MRSPTHTRKRTIMQDEVVRVMRAVANDTPVAGQTDAHVSADAGPHVHRISPSGQANPTPVATPQPHAVSRGHTKVCGGQSSYPLPEYMMAPSQTMPVNMVGAVAIPPSILLKLPLNEIDSRFLIASERQLLNALISSLKDRS